MEQSFTGQTNRHAGAASDARPLDDFQRNFLREELDARRAAVERLADAVDRDAHVAVLAAAAFWSWFATHTQDLATLHLRWLVVLVPALLTLGFVVRWCLLQSWIRTQADYVRKVEALMNLPKGLGWEHFLAPSRSTTRIPRFPVLHGAFWLLLLAINVCVAWQSLA